MNTWYIQVWTALEIWIIHLQYPKISIWLVENPLIIFTSKKNVFLGSENSRSTQVESDCVRTDILYEYFTTYIAFKIIHWPVICFKFYSWDEQTPFTNTIVIFLSYFWGRIKKIRQFRTSSSWIWWWTVPFVHRYKHSLHTQWLG